MYTYKCVGNLNSQFCYNAIAVFSRDLALEKNLVIKLIKTHEVALKTLDSSRWNLVMANKHVQKFALYKQQLNIYHSVKANRS
jgi:hypothetical protein